MHLLMTTSFTQRALRQPLKSFSSRHNISALLHITDQPVVLLSMGICMNVGICTSAEMTHLRKNTENSIFAGLN
jgi:hypothetical protein